MKFVLVLVVASFASALAGGALAMTEEHVVQIDSDWIEIDGTFTAD